jgi:flagellar hook-basal body complex protein FliE
MDISAIKGIMPSTSEIISRKTEAAGANFGDILEKSLSQIDDNIAEVNGSIEGLLSGSSEDFHEFLIASEKATVGLQLTLQMRNKVVDAYKEIMRMQV